MPENDGLELYGLAFDGVKVKAKVLKVHTLDIAPLRSEIPLQTRAATRRTRCNGVS